MYNIFLIAKNIQNTNEYNQFFLIQAFANKAKYCEYFNLKKSL